MAKSVWFKYYSDKLARCKTPDELLKLSREISRKSFRADEKSALILSCVYIAKQFDKAGKKVKGGSADEVSSLDHPAEM